MRQLIVIAYISRYILGILLIILSTISILQAQNPAWWSTYQVLNTSASPDDYTVANQGQAKNIASKARIYFNDNIPNDAGVSFKISIDNMVNSWATPTGTTDNYAALNLGQLKNLAQPFYDRLNAVGYAIPRPWTTGDDYTIVNLGQLKNVFSFTIPSLVANPKTLVAVEDTPLPINLTATGVGNLTYSLISSPDAAKGSLTGTPPNLTFNPVANYNGTGTSFVFQVANGITTSQAAITISSITSVNDTPVATAQSVTAVEDTAKSITLSGTDIEGSVLTFSVVTPPNALQGTLGGTPPNLIFTPAANYNGSTSFTFKTNDGAIDSAPATVSITVTPVNDLPVATPQSITVFENTAQSITLSGSDVENSPLIYSIVTPPASGTGSLSGTAPNLTFTPATNFVGSTSFTFKVNDGAADSSIGTVNITVNPAIYVNPGSLSATLLTSHKSGHKSLLLNNPTSQSVNFTVTTPNQTPGYYYDDSNTANIPFVWQDISVTGTHLNTISDADDASEVVPITGFQFPFFGQNYSSIFATSNGCIIFGSNISPYNNTSLPAQSISAPIIAALWDDLNTNLGGDIYYKQESDKLIIQYQGVKHIGSSGTYTFEIVLYANGNIDLRYLDVNGLLDSCTVGIQDATGSSGFQVVNNGLYLKNNLAISITSKFLNVTPLSGSVPANGNIQLDAIFSSQTLTVGTYTGNILISHNGAGISPINIPATLDVLLDSDQDGLSDAQEIALGTNKNKRDTDNDGVSDGKEVEMGANPLVSDPWATRDSDNDGLTDLTEIILGTNPYNRDTNNNGTYDGPELDSGGDPINPGPAPTPLPTPSPNPEPPADPSPTPPPAITPGDYDILVETKNISFPKYGYPPFQTIVPPKRYLTHFGSETFTGGNPESGPIGYPKAGSVTIDPLTGIETPNGDGMVGGGTNQSPVRQQGTRTVSDYDDPPNQVDDESATIQTMATLAQENTTTMMAVNAKSKLPAFSNTFTAGTPFAYRNVHKNELEFDYQKVQFKFKWKTGTLPAAYHPIKYLVIFTPEDDPTTLVIESDSPEIVNIITWDGQAAESPTYEVDPDTLKPSKDGSHYLAQINIIPDVNMSGILGDLVPSNNGLTGEKHFVSPQKSAEITDDSVILTVSGIDANYFSKLLIWEGGEAVSGQPLQRQVKRNIPAKTVVKLKAKTGSQEADKLNVWIVWTAITPTPGTPLFNSLPSYSEYRIQNYGNTAWRFIFSIQPGSIITDGDHPGFEGISGKPVPGAGKPYFANPSGGDGDSAPLKWDTSRQVSVTIQNPGLISKPDLAVTLPNSVLNNQPKAHDLALQFPSNAVEGNDDPNDPSEECNPYQISNVVALNHQIGEISSSDAPGSAAINSWGTANDQTYDLKINFHEFARLQIWDEKRNSGQFWFRISDQLAWHHALSFKFTIPPSKWNDSGSSATMGLTSP